MSYQFGRKANLLFTTTDNTGALDKGLDLSNMQFTFHTHAPDANSPWHAEIKIYNLSQSTINKLKGEFTGVMLQAGYGTNSGDNKDGAYGIIFTGTIKQYRIGRDSAVDTFLEVYATDGDLAHNFGIINTTVAAGSSYADRLKACNDSFKQYGAEMPQAGRDKPIVNGGILPRGKVMFGMTRDHMQDIAASSGHSWFIENGKVVMVKVNGYREGTAVQLTSHTGLIGRPEQTNGGVMAQCLLNPNIKTGTLVKIYNHSINQTVAAKGNPFNLPHNQWAAAQPPDNVNNDKALDTQMLAYVAADGLYKVLVAEHEGDTRGTAWYTNIVCLAANPLTKSINTYGG